jgi:hypothetical protein
MITAAILRVLADLLNAVVQGFFSAIPDASLPQGITDSLSAIQGYLATLSPIIPMVALLATVAFIVFVEIAIFSYKGMMWLIKKIPTIS